VKLADLRKLSIRQQLRIGFHLANGQECVVNERGVAEVPGLDHIPDFNLEQELASATEFTLDPAGAHVQTGRKAAPQARRIGRGELDTMLAPVSPGAAAPDHEEE
jgi:hypothetical protein